LAQAHRELARLLTRLDGRGYKSYQQIKGEWTFPWLTLRIDHVQGDPFAAPSRVSIQIPSHATGLAEELCRPGPRAIGTACFLARRFQERAQAVAPSHGSGRSGEIRMEAPGQAVIPNTAVQVAPDGALEARFRVGLPARGRRILGTQAERLLLEALPRVAEGSLLARTCDERELSRHADVNEDATALRSELADRKLVGFIGDGSVLPRRSGIDDRPLEGPEVVPFRAPDRLESVVELPNRGRIRGMGIPRGVTLVVGGGYHGKSTLLNALERGVYNHRPGDGRELAVTDPEAVKIRAEDGRAVAGVDISAFIKRLPGGIDTRRFTTPDASGSTSQAAGIMEAMESGASTLLIDEDTSATNFMIRDHRMQVLVPRHQEPIIPFIDRVRELFESRGVSSVLVLGGSGDYLDVADTVVAMTEFHPNDVTIRAREVASSHPTGRRPETPEHLANPPPRRPLAESVDPSRGRRRVSLKVRGTRAIQFGSEEIDLSGIIQVVSWAQARAIGEGLLLARHRFMDGSRSVPEILDLVENVLETEGLDALGHGHDGDLALFRRHELAAALNRLRTLEVAAE